MKNVLLIEPTIRPVGVEYLKERFNVFIAKDDTESELISIIKKNKIDAVVTRTEIISEQIIKKCPSLKVIGQHGVGVNNIDLVAATKAGIYVVNVPDATYESVAEHTMMSILALSRKLVRNDSEVRKGNWMIRDQDFPNEISTKTLFIIGFGRIGRKVLEFGNAFNMNVIVYDPFVEANSEVRIVNKLEDGLKVADYITLHLPLLDSTHNLISKNEFKKMKKTAYLINASRGEVINQEELINALKNEEIAGAALDVLKDEPPEINDPILKLKNVILTPHIAGDTQEAKNRCSRILAKEVSNVLLQGESKNIINKKEVLNLYKIT